MMSWSKKILKKLDFEGINTTSLFFYLILGLVILLGVFGRFLDWQYFQYAIWADRDLLRAQAVWDTLPVTGPEFLMRGRTPGGGYYYFLWLLQSLSKNPQIIIIYLNMLYLVSAVLLFFTVKRYLGLFVGVATSAIYIGMFFAGTSFTSQIWSPAVLSIPYVIAAYLILRIGVDHKHWAVLCLFGLSAICGQVHFSGYSLSIIAYVMALIFQIKLSAKKWLLAFIIFLTPLSPYFIVQFGNGFEDLILSFDGQYERYLHYNFASEEVSIKHSLYLRLVWFKDIATSIFGILQNEPVLKLLNIPTLDILINKVLYFSTYFIFSLFWLGVFIIGYKTYADVLSQQEKSLSKIHFFKRIKFLYIRMKSNIIITNRKNSLSPQQIKASYLASLLVAITVGTGTIMLVGPNVQFRYVAWALPLVAMVAGLALGEIYIIKERSYSKITSFIIILILPFWMILHSVMNTVVYSYPSTATIKYKQLMEILTTTSQKFGWGESDFNSKILFVHYDNKNSVLMTKYAAWTAINFLTQQIKNNGSQNIYSGCLVAIDTSITGINPQLTEEKFMQIWSKSIKRNPNQSSELILGMHVDWIRPVKNFIYVGYRLPNGNCLKNMTNQFDLYAEEKLAQIYAKELNHGKSITLPKENGFDKYVVKYRGQTHWSPVVFLLDISQKEGLISIDVHANKLRGYNGIDQNEILNTRLIFTEKDTGQTTTLPIITGGLGFFDHGAYILPYTPWHLTPTQLSPGTYQIRLASDDVNTLGGRFTFSRPRRNYIGGVSITVTNKFIMK